MRKLFTYLTVFALTICCLWLPVRTQAAQIVDSGKCGDNTTWTLDSDGVLTISGTGSTKNYSLQEYPVWYEKHSMDIKTVIVEEGVTGLGNGAFGQCYNLTSISFPSTLKRIGFGVFGQCTGLTSITIPDSVTELAFGAFYGCTSLTSIVIPEGITLIDTYMFSGCTALTTIVIPASVTSIGPTAFDQCENLKNILFTGTQEQWNAIAIDATNTALTAAKVHAGSTAKVTKASTCQQEGVKTYSCTCCATPVTQAAVIGRSTDHNYKNATCTDPKICADCGKTDGSALGHSYRLGSCTRCGAIDENFKALDSGIWTWCSMLDNGELRYVRFRFDGEQLYYTDDSAFNIKTLNQENQNTLWEDQPARIVEFQGGAYVLPMASNTIVGTYTLDGATIRAAFADMGGDTIVLVREEGNKLVVQETSGEMSANLQTGTVFAYEEDPHKHCFVVYSCTEPKKCFGCGETKGEAVGHTPVVDAAVSATCTENGLTEGSHCSVCAEVLTDQNLIPAKGHEDLNGDYICDICSVAICLEHTPQTIEGTPATCTRAGLSDGSKCSICGQILAAQKLTTALGHTWEDATCETAKTCSVCHKTQGRPLGHEWVDATCETAKTCSVCNKIEGNALGHKWENATCEDPKTCSGCNKTEGKALGHKWENATCDDPKTCSACGKTEGSALGHSFGQWTEVKAPTTEQTGLSRRTCSACGATEEKVIEKLDLPATEPPTEKPTEAPTEEPTDAPTEEPTEAPTEKPTEKPTEAPTEAPDNDPPITEDGKTVLHDDAITAEGGWQGIFRMDTQLWGGRLDPAIFVENGRLEITLSCESGDLLSVHLILQGTGADNDWQQIDLNVSELTANSDGSYTAVFTYEALIAEYGSADFSDLGALRVYCDSDEDAQVTLRTVLYDTNEMEAPTEPEETEPSAPQDPEKPANSTGIWAIVLAVVLGVLFAATVVVLILIGKTRK